LVQLFLDLPFRQTVAHREQELTAAPVSRLLEETAAFYQLELHRHPESTRCVEQRGPHDPALIEELGIGYAPAEICGGIWLLGALPSIGCRRLA
jgi:hypothetical protein